MKPALLVVVALTVLILAGSVAAQPKQPQPKQPQPNQQKEPKPEEIGAFLALGCFGWACIIIVGGAIFIGGWSVPVWVAYYRESPNFAMVCVLCLVLGWNPIGWFASLLWALKGPTEVIIRHRDD